MSLTTRLFLGAFVILALLPCMLDVRRSTSSSVNLEGSDRTSYTIPRVKGPPGDPDVRIEFSSLDISDRPLPLASIVTGKQMKM